MPRWLTEGISIYEEHRRRAAWGRELTLEFAHLLGKGKTFGVKKLPDAFKHPETLSLAYFEASLVVEHLVALNGDAGLRTLLEAYADGANDERGVREGIRQERRRSSTRPSRRSSNSVTASCVTPWAIRRSQVARDNLPGLAPARRGGAGQLRQPVRARARAVAQRRRRRRATAPLERAAELAPQATRRRQPARAAGARSPTIEGDVTRARRELRAPARQRPHQRRRRAPARRRSPRGAGALDDETSRCGSSPISIRSTPTRTGCSAAGCSTRNRAAALIEFQAALALGPANLAEAHTDVAEALLKLGRKDDAKQSALLALKEAPTFARAQDLLLIAIGRKP